MNIRDLDVCCYCGRRWPRCHLVLFGSSDIYGNPCCPGCDPDIDNVIPATWWQRIKAFAGLSYTARSGASVRQHCRGQTITLPIDR